jgi:hypothetical protein
MDDLPGCKFRQVVEMESEHMPAQKSWIVTTSAERPIHEITDDLKEAGFDVGQVLEEVNSITGAASDTAVAKLRSIKGVVDVSPDTPIDIGPPGSPETW